MIKLDRKAVDSCASASVRIRNSRSKRIEIYDFLRDQVPNLIRFANHVFSGLRLNLLVINPLGHWTPLPLGGERNQRCFTRIC
jgi:hypothetical protein